MQSEESTMIRNFALGALAHRFKIINPLFIIYRYFQFKKNGDQVVEVNGLIEFGVGEAVASLLDQLS